MSWGGRGREDETRERMIDAARRSGFSVSELVEALSRKGSSGEPRDQGVRQRNASSDDRLDRGRGEPAEIDRQLDELAERLRDLSSANAAPARPRARARDRAADATLEEIAATVDRLSRQVPEAAPRRPARAHGGEDIGAVLAALDGLDRRVRAMSEERSSTRPRRERAAVAELDLAVDEIARRQASLETDKRPRRATAGGSDIERHFRELSDKIEQLRQRDERNSPEALIEEIRALRKFVEKRAGSGVDVGAEIRKLTQRIDEMASHNPGRAALEPLMTEMGHLRDAVLASDVEGSLKSLEAGYGHIVDRLDELKRGLASPRVGASVDAEISEIHNLLRAVPQVSQFSSIEQSLRDLAGKVERLSTEDEERDVVRIERRLGELKSQIDRIDPAPVVKSLDQRLKLVTDKLDAIEKAARGPVTPDRIVGLLDELRASSAGSGTQEEMRALETRLAELSERIADLDRRRPSFDDTDRLHDRIAEIAGKLDRMAVPFTDRRTVDALEGTISRLDELMSRQQAPVPAGMVDGRVAELLDRLDRGGASPGAGEIEALGRQIADMRREIQQARPAIDLEAEMRKLAERLDRSVAHEPDDEALNQIEEQLASISRQLEATGSRFDGISGLEATLRRLDDRLGAHQADTLAAAREAAREMVRELDVGRGDGAAEEVLRALQDDLRSLRSAARDTENRTNDTLVSLHDALTGIVGRLSAIEKIAQGSARAAAARPAATEAPAVAPAAVAATAAAPAAVRAPAVEPARAMPTPSAPSTATTGQPAPGGGIASTIARAREALSANAAEDTRPLEPGSGKPTPRAATVTPPTAAMTPTTIQQAPAAAPPSGETAPAAARKADFIAAARRAAQAAAGAAEAPLTARPEDRASTKSGGEDAGEASANSALARIGQVLKARRRPLVLATGALVLAVMTMRLIPGGDRPVEIADTPKRETQQTAERKPTQTPVAPEKTTAVDERTAAAPVAIQPQAPAAPVTTDKPQAAAQPTTPERPQATALPVAPEKPQAVAPATGAPQAISAQPAQRTGALSRPLPDASLLDAPATTGSIAGTEAARSAGSASSPIASLPMKIGSDKLRRAAEAGDARAAFEVGMRFAEGRGVPTDPKAAAEWYARAAEKGLVPAQYRWAVALEKGIGVTRDSEQAKRWYSTAAEAGNVRAMHNLGVLFANSRDIASALPWFQKAADLGLKDSQFNLGIIHALGSGVKQDLAVSYKWFALAARQGDKEAEKKQNDVATHLDKVNLAAARMAVQTWVQKPLDREANEEAQVWAEPKDAPKAASAGDRGAVGRVQGLLQSRGLYGGPIDGQASAATRSAIKAFQKKVGRPQTGEIDDQLLQLLSGKSL